jgi:hypothetical protein
MSFGEKILVKIREQKAISSEEKGKFNFTQLQEDDCQFQIKYKDIDKYGIVIDNISITKEIPIIDTEMIKKKLELHANQVQKKISYLLEDFKLIEFDKMNKRAQLRSYPPHQKDDLKYYYEIILEEGTKAHFQRYEYSRSQKRFMKITSQFTLEIFERLIDDLFEILC